MNVIKKVVNDLIGLYKVLGALYAMKWLGALAANNMEIIKKKNLQAADQRMGKGPFKVKFSDSVMFWITGSGAFSGIREMYVRDVYLRRGVLEIENGDIVVDLGSNMGNFTNLALAHGPSVRVVAVEPNSELNRAWKESIHLNKGFAERADLIRAFVGDMGDLQQNLLHDPRYADARWLSENEFIAASKINHINFLKCDIEGGEFGLLMPGSKILSMTQKIAIEVHQFAGDVDAFLGMLSAEGFSIKYIQRDPDGSVIALGSAKGPMLFHMDSAISCHP